MIIDQLTPLSPLLDTDEFAVERGVLTYKTPLSTISSGLGIPSIESDVETLTTSLTTLTSTVTSIQSAAQNKVLYIEDIPCTATTGDFATVSNNAITTDHVVTECVFSIPSAIITVVDWTTATSSLKLNGTCTDANCTVDIVLIKKDN